jgi:hypothetical protein
MSVFCRCLVAITALAVVALPATAAQVIVEKTVPEHTKPHFFERIQAGDLAAAIAQRGRPVDVKPGKYHLRVPCDSMVPGSFTDITVVVDEHATTRLRLVECGVLLENRGQSPN